MKRNDAKVGKVVQAVIKVLPAKTSSPLTEHQETRLKVAVGLIKSVQAR